ncbi:MAG: metallophosphoesterase [Acidobacteriota bacterium]|nr:metallophosphoesterase [Acidobacteriota bacterium]
MITSLQKARNVIFETLRADYVALLAQDDAELMVFFEQLFRCDDLPVDMHFFEVYLPVDQDNYNAFLMEFLRDLHRSVKDKHPQIEPPETDISASQAFQHYLDKLKKQLSRGLLVISLHALARVQFQPLKILLKKLEDYYKRIKTGNPFRFVVTGGRHLWKLCSSPDSSISPFNIAEPILVPDRLLGELQMLDPQRGKAIFEMTHGVPELIDSIPEGKAQVNISDFFKIIKKYWRGLSPGSKEALKEKALISDFPKCEGETDQGNIPVFNIDPTTDETIWYDAFWHGFLRCQNNKLAWRSPAHRAFVETQVKSSSSVHTPQIARTLSWLHLSDFHFKDELKLSEEPKINCLIRDIIVPHPKPDMVFVTGDIAFSGKRPEYEVAIKQFTRLARKLGHDPKLDWFIVPGNHDVDRGIKSLRKSARKILASKEEADTLLEEAYTWRIFSSRQREFRNFIRRFLGEDRAWKPSTPWRVETYTKDDIAVAILCLNTAWASQDDNDKGALLFGEFQIRHAIKEARVLKPDLQIALHHHPPDELVGHDMDSYTDLLKSECNVLLHGHVHNPKMDLSSISENLELRAGATNAENKDELAILRCTLDLDNRKIEVQAWKWEKKNGERWEPYKLHLKMGTDGIWTQPFPSTWFSYKA